MKFKIIFRSRKILTAIHSRLPKPIRNLIKIGLRPVRKVLEALLKLTYEVNQHPSNAVENRIQQNLNSDFSSTTEIQNGSQLYDTQKETILVVSHEDSRTGAPIIILNLANRLQNNYNIVFLLLNIGFAGSIKEYFLQSGSYVLGPIGARDNQDAVNHALRSLFKRFKFKFALVNSVESYVVLGPLARKRIPSVTLIHEFACITRPKRIFHEVILWTTNTIFSTSLIMENVFFEFPELRNHHSRIIPQGYCIVPSKSGMVTDKLEEKAKLLNIMRPGGQQDDAIVILGIGTITIRKGVDLFIECAAAALRSGRLNNFRFIWIGKGYDEDDLNYSVYLKEQIRGCGLSKYVFIVEEISDPGIAYAAADLLLISSRLDPLPNIGIEAMMHHIPLICFEQASGFAKILIEHGLGNECVVPYLDTLSMADKVISFALSKTLRQQVGKQLYQLALIEFNMDTYSQRIEQIGLDSVELIQQEQRDLVTILNAGVSRLDFYLPNTTNLDMDFALQFYIRTWASGSVQRKLFAGFHPGIFKEQYPAYKPGYDPLAQYLRANQPDGPWKYTVITPQDKKIPIPGSKRIALHLHIYYPDLTPRLIFSLNQNQVKPDLFISVPSDRVLNEVQEIISRSYSGKIVDIKIVPNKGRDIGPFFTTFGNSIINNYDVIGHVHTKKTIHLEDKNLGKQWFEFLIENLLGGKNSMADIILGRLTTDPTIGMIFPDDPYVIGWDLNRSHAEKLGQKLGLKNLPENIWFPIGTMFWSKVESLLPLFRLGLGLKDYPDEPIPIDGTVLHALERLIPSVVIQQGFRCAVTNVEGTNRQ